MEKCKHCEQPISESQYKKDKQYKSCPGCSFEDGQEHIYYLYPDEFGITPLRSSQKSPEGAQSYCRSCRANNPPIHDGNKRCSEL